jgi:dolichol-phosphate mannosyltransferase
MCAPIPCLSPNSYEKIDWAAVVPVANEEPEWEDFRHAFVRELDLLGSGKVYLIVDDVSTDRTRELCQDLSKVDPRFVEVYAPENRSVVDAYIRGFREAYAAGHEYIIEMDAGLSHDPRAIPMFLRVLNEGNECAFGSRYINGGSMVDSPWNRRLLSRGGSILARILLGTNMHDLTSGFEGFHRGIVGRILAYPLKSRAHFYQTEIRHLLRHSRWIEVPIHYRAPSPRVSRNAIKNSLATLAAYFLLRLLGRSPHL